VESFDLMRNWQAIKAEENPEDPWEELLKLAMHDPVVARTVDMVRYRGMSIGDACMHLALYQTRRAMTLQEQAVNWLKINPAPLIVDAKQAAEFFGIGKTDAQHKAG
jgi:hypothetical protein